jgi:TonB family protein
LVAPGASVLSNPKLENEGFQKKELLAPKHQRPKTKQKESERQVQAAVSPNRDLRPGMPGFILGSLASGIASDQDVRIALPVHAPDPPIVRAKLPEWIRGDVIVEVTISEAGEVTDTVVLETVGYGLEQTVVETLRKWRWIPATIDGVKVASKQDVRFHFPS